MAFIVVYDACVLYPAAVRDFLMHLALTDLYQVRWSEEILEEMRVAVLRERTDLKPENLDRTVSLMKSALPGSMTEGQSELVESLQLPDPDDRHVLATAIRSHSQVIVTENIKDFPSESLDQYDIEAQTVDQFVMHAITLNEAVVIGALHKHVANLKNPPVTVLEVLENLSKLGLVESASYLRSRLQS